MNKIINKFLLTGDKFIQEWHLIQPGFFIVLVSNLLNTTKRLKFFRETSNLKHLYRNELDKACFALMQHILIVNI